MQQHDVILAVCNKHLVHKQFTTNNTLYSLPQQTAKAADAMQPVALLQKCMYLGI